MCDDGQSRHVKMFRQIYGYEEIELAVRQMEGWAADVMGLVVAEGGAWCAGWWLAGERVC